ncbi:MAG: hypothetical protein WBA28_00475 [Microbacteriaceae bacterium]
MEGEQGAGTTPPADGAPSEPNGQKTGPENDREYLESLRQEAAANRVAAKEAKDAAEAQATELAKFKTAFSTALGIEPEETDPEKLKAKLAERDALVTEKDAALTTAQAAAKAAELNVQVAIHAHGLGANAELLLTNKEFKDSIAEVDPSDKAAIQAAITKAIQANAALKATPPRSGGGEHQGPTVTTLETQLKAAEEKKDTKLVISLKRQIAALRASN